MGIFSFLPVKEHFGKLWSLRILVMVIAIVNLVMGLAYALTFANDLASTPIDGKPRTCDFANEIQAYFFFQVCFIGLYLGIGSMLTIAFYLTKRQGYTDFVIILFIIQSALSFALLSQFIWTKFTNESWNWSNCTFPNVSYMLPFLSAIISNPFFIIYVNSFGEPLPLVEIAGGAVISSRVTSSEIPKPAKAPKKQKVYKKTETHSHK